LSIISRYVKQVKARFCKFFCTKATQGKMEGKLHHLRSEFCKNSPNKLDEKKNISEDYLKKLDKLIMDGFETGTTILPKPVQ
jgi:hypothetical protein